MLVNSPKRMSVSSFYRGPTGRGSDPQTLSNLEELIVPVERHALGEAPRELLDLSRRKALGEPRVQSPAQRADGAGMDVRDARVHPGPEQEVREVDDDALVERKSRPDRERVVVGQGAELELRDRFELRRRQPRRLCQRRVLCESVRAARERGDDEDAEL